MLERVADRPLSAGCVLLLLLGACHKDDAAASDAGSAASATPVASSAPPPTTSASDASKNASAPIDAGANGGFEDEFAYGSAADPVDAGRDDPARIAKPVHYAPYGNGRFGFALDVPTAFVAMGDPANGDGLQWRLGHLAAMTASGMNYLPEVDSSLCNPHAEVHTATKSSCFSTGKQGGWIFWERHVVAHGVDFSLRFQYAESLKAAMDEIVTHVNKSWTHGSSAPGLEP